MKKLTGILAAVALLFALGTGFAVSQSSGANFGFLTVGAGSAGTTAVGDVNITGSYKIAGVTVAGPTVGTTTNCSSGASPAVCAAASAGSAAVAVGTNPTLVVNTTAVTANSQIFIQPDESLGTKLSVTCNTTITTVAPIVVTARTAGTSFTVQVDATVGTNPACFSFLIVN